MDFQTINILLLKSSYSGAYDSFNDFFDTIKKGFELNGCKVYEAHSVNEAMCYMKKMHIDFTVNIGKYHFNNEGIALYEWYKVINYQWIIDNPIRYDNCDTISEYNRMVLIDDNFRLCPGFSRTDYVTLSLPFNWQNGGNYNEKAIVAPIKIVNELEYWQRLRSMNLYSRVANFIEQIDLSASFIEQFLRFVKENEINEINEIKNAFEISNGIIRARKRYKMVNAIKDYPVIVLSNVPEKMKFNKNVLFKNPCSYNELQKLLLKYKYIMNCNPNYDICLHDRISHGISAGRIVISDTNLLLKKMGMPMCVDFDKLDEMNNCIENAELNYERILKEQQRCITPWESRQAVKKILLNFKENRIL